MIVEYTGELTIAEQTMNMLKILQQSRGRTSAIILSRLESHKEIVALVPTGKPKDKEAFYWVCLSSTDSGSFLSGNEGREITDCAHTIITDGWKIQPNAKIIVE